MSSGMGRGRGSGSTGAGGSGDKRDLRGTIQPDLFTRKNGASKTGTSGRPQPCYANFIPIDMEKADYMIYQYHVEFTPSVDSKHAREKMLLHPNVVDEIGKYHVFDGMIMYMITEWENTQTLEVPHPTTKEPVAVTFKLTSRYGLNDAQTINTFNTIIRRCFDDMGLTQLGRHYFDTSAGKMVREYNMRILPGYETAIRMYEEQLMLCIENRFKMVRMDTMLDLVRKEQRQSVNQQRVEEKMNELYGGSTIVTLYNNKLHRFTRIDFSLSPLTVFEKDGVEITLKAYFEQQYHKTITDDSQPIIISEGKPKQPGEPPQLNYLIPELCNPTGLTDEMRKDFKMMREIATHTRMSPSQRLTQTRNLLEKFNNVTNVRLCLDSWGIRMSNDLANLTARVLPAENLIGDVGKQYQGQNAEWARGVKSAGIFRGAVIKNWIVIAPTSGNQGFLTKKFIDETQRLAASMKVTIGDPLCVPLSSDVSPTCYLKNLKEALSTVDGHEVHMIVVILADDNKTRYDSVKKFLCVECPTPSQCVNIRTLSGKASDGGENKNFSSIVLKIVLQMICKAGGALWKVNIPLPDTMIVGYDLYHDSTLRGKTVGACVSTTDPNFTSFYSQTRPHENPTQLGTNLTHFIRKALKKYYDCNDQKLPSRIILYRDGAGDGQIPYIRNTEVKLVTDACLNVAERAAEMTGSKKIQEISLAFIIVTKRVNMRILKQSQKDATNPEPGTVVDSVVTRPERMDFYLVPQFVNQGTVTPVSYNIIYDDTDLNPDKHHRLAFKLCHVYYNWQGTVRVPAPCQYAHKLAFLTAQSLHEETHETLRSKLFFL